MFLIFNENLYIKHSTEQTTIMFNILQTTISGFLSLTNKCCWIT